MDASGAPVTDELTGVHYSPQRDAIYEPEKTARRKAHNNATSLLYAKVYHSFHRHNLVLTVNNTVSSGVRILVISILCSIRPLSTARLKTTMYQTQRHLTYESGAGDRYSYDQCSPFSHIAGISSLLSASLSDNPYISNNTDIVDVSLQLCCKSSSLALYANHRSLWTVHKVLEMKGFKLQSGLLNLVNVA